jgi:hypothetical protein
MFEKFNASRMCISKQGPLIIFAIGKSYGWL